jgi:hypothetical protein
VHFKHKNITNLSLLHANKIMKAISDLANILKSKPLVTAQQEQKICNLTGLVEATSMQGTPNGAQTKQKRNIFKGAFQGNTSKGARVCWI